MRVLIFHPSTQIELQSKVSHSNLEPLFCSIHSSMSVLVICSLRIYIMDNPRTELFVIPR